MAINVADNFSYLGGKPLDARVKYDTIAEMVAVPAANLYDGCMAYVTATKLNYQYDSTNEEDATLGKWREYSSGGASSVSELSDVYLYSLTDGQVLVWDATAGKWKNSNDGGSTIKYIPDLRPGYMQSFTGANKASSSSPIIVVSGTMPSDTVIDSQLITSIGGVVIRKSSSEQPETETDGTLLADIPVTSDRTFSIDDSDVVEGTTYYYSAFPYTLEEKNYSRNATNARVNVVASLTPTFVEAENISYDDAYGYANTYVDGGYMAYESTIMIVNADSYYTTSDDIINLAWNKSMTRGATNKTVGNITTSSSASPLVLTFNTDGYVVLSDSSNDINNMAAMNNTGNVFSTRLVSAGDTLSIPVSYSTWVSFYSLA